MVWGRARLGVWVGLLVVQLAVLTVESHSGSRFLLWEYFYTSGFNDKRTRFLYFAIATAVEWDWRFVLPWFNVYLNGTSGRQDFRSFSYFFNQTVLEKHLPVADAGHFLRRCNRTVEFIVMTPEIAQERHALSCTSGTVLPSQNLVTQMFGKEELLVRGTNVACFSSRDLTQTFKDPSSLLMRASSVLLHGFDRYGVAGPGPYSSRLPDRAKEAARFIQFHRQWYLKAETFLAKLDWNPVPYFGVTRSHVPPYSTFFTRLAPSSGNFAAFHWRWPNRPKELQANVSYVATLLRAALELHSQMPLRLFVSGAVATRGQLNSLAQLLGPDVSVVTGDYDVLSPGDAIVVDQIMCTMATTFYGSTQSTFTEAILELRDQMGFKDRTAMVEHRIP